MIDISGNPEAKGSNGALIGVLCGLLLVAAAAAGSYKVIAAGKPAPIDAAAIQQAVRSADMDWSRAAGAHNLTAVVSYYGDGAVMLPPNAPMATDALAIRKQWAAMLPPEVAATWTPGRVEVAAAGDLVYDVGTYTAITRATRKARGSTDSGKYMSIWKKQADGNWKVASQIWNSDKPEAGEKK